MVGHYLGVSTFVLLLVCGHMFYLNTYNTEEVCDVRVYENL